MRTDTLQAAIGSTYAVEGELTGGGMSRVFIARDESLGRRVVVKVLHPELAAGCNIERFRREIRVAAQLAHPNIVPLLHAGEAEGLPYYTMPLMQGESLRTRLRREHRLPVADAVRIAREVAEALDYAHRQGVIHRDVKPENILLQDGRALVTDFGIAKALVSARVDATDAGSAEVLTGMGSAIGTPTYMAPEQAAGDPDIDVRADIYSLGCVLFELLTGAPPYTGSPSAVIAKHFSAPVPRARTVRPDLPATLDEVIATAMGKDPATRFASAAEFAAALERRATTSAARSISIAVLPFENLSGDPANDYLSDGITEEILTTISRLAGLRVAALASVFALRGQDRDARAIAAALDVRHLLQGSVRRAGNRLRISAQLVDAESGFQLWSDRFDRELRDVFAIEDDIAAIIARRLEVHFGADVPARRRTTSLDAYDAYLRGRHTWNAGTPAAWHESVAWYERALGADPDYADPWVGIAQSLSSLSFFAGDAAVSDRARDAVRHAIQLDPGNAEAHAVAAFVSFWLEWDFAGAERAARRAVELNPSSSLAHETLSALLANMGKTEESLAISTRSLELDPLALSAHQTRAWVLTAAGRYQESVERSRVGLELAPNSLFGFVGLAWALVELGQLGDARRAYDALLQIAPDSGIACGGLAVTEARAGNRSAAQAWLAKARASSQPSYTFLAWACAALGMADEAFEALDRAIEAREASATCMPVFTWWDPLRHDPRFLAALRKGGYPESSFVRTHEFLTRAQRS